MGYWKPHLDLPECGPARVDSEALLIFYLGPDGLPDWVQFRSFSDRSGKYVGPKGITMPLFSSVLWANDDGPVVMVEGAFDALIAWQAGVNAVALTSAKGDDPATYTTALEALFESMGRGRRLVLALDPDKAGQLATEGVRRACAQLGKLGRVDELTERPPVDMSDWWQQNPPGFTDDLHKAISTATPCVKPLPTAQDLLPGLWEQLERYRSAKPLPTGLPTFDELTGGLRPGLHIVAGSPGAGKSAIALAWAVKTINDGGHALYVPLEQTANEIVGRVLSTESGRGLRGYWSGSSEWVKDAEKAAGRLALDHLIIAPDPFILNDVQGTLSRLEQRIAQLLDQRPDIDPHRLVVVVDFLQRCRPPATTRKMDEREILTHTVEGLRDLAMKHELVVIAISSMNREARRDQAVPTMASLHGAGAIEYSADTVSILYTEKTDDKAKSKAGQMIPCRLCRDKNRYGPVANGFGSREPLRLFFDREFGSFREQPGKTNKKLGGSDGPTTGLKPV